MSLSVAAEELGTHCRKHPAAYELLRRFDVVPALPKNAMGKILKKELMRAAQSDPQRKAINS